MNDNPFKPQTVKLFNYNNQNIESKKLQEINKKMCDMRGGVIEGSVGYTKPSYSDVIKTPKSYGDIMPKQERYSDHITPKSYRDMLNGNKGN